MHAVWIAVALASGGCGASHDPDVDDAEVRLLSPLSTSTVTSQQPTLRWVLGDATEARVELCRDRACTVPVEALVGETSARPSSPLSPGWYFWRVRAGTAVSATWQFAVGVRSAPVDTHFGVAFDVNGDGFIDSFEAGRAIHHGTATGIEHDPTTVVRFPDRCGLIMRAAGDVNGDGYGDVVISAYSYDFGPGGRCSAENEVRLLLGGPDGATTGTAAVVRVERMVDYPHGIGDVDGDGYGDIAVEHGAYYRERVVEVWFGSARGLDDDRMPQRLTVPFPLPSIRAESTLVVTADFDGDRRSDVVIGPAVYLGREEGFGPPDFVFDREPKSSAVGDVNGDGRLDWAVASDVIDASLEPARVSVFHAQSEGIAGGPDTVLIGPDQYFGRFVELDDGNGDGFDDLTVWGMPGPILGSADGLVTP